VVELIEGVVQGEPVPSEVPPVNAVYHARVPLEAVARRLTVPVPQRVAGNVSVIVPEAHNVVALAVGPVDE